MDRRHILIVIARSLIYLVQFCMDISSSSGILQESTDFLGRSGSIRVDRSILNSGEGLIFLFRISKIETIGCQQSQIHKICLILYSSALPWFHTGRVRISVVWLISLHHLHRVLLKLVESSQVSVILGILAVCRARYTRPTSHFYSTLPWFSTGRVRISSTGIHVIPSTLELRNIHDVQSFLGFANFYHHFIVDYSQMTLPLMNLCKKATPWNFGQKETTVFQTLKNTFSTAPVLCHWAPDLQMTVETDASDHVIAGILSVTTKDNEIRLVAFFSCSLQGAEKNYDTHDKELLAIFEVFKNWRHFLEGSAEVINTVTDHKNLEYFTSSKKLSHCQARWAEFLGQFNMKVQFRLGRLGSKPDALTRRWDVYTEGDNPEPTATNVHLVFTIEQLAGTPVLVHARTMEDPTPSNNLDHDALAESITTAYAEDDLAKKIHEQIKTANQPDGWTEREGCLLFCEQKYVPNKGTLRLHTIRDHHNHPTAGHFGETKTMELICHNYHWPGLRRMVGDYIRSCTSCTCTKATCHKPYGLLKQLPNPGQPWA